jgi:hypothetical protein
MKRSDDSEGRELERVARRASADCLRIVRAAWAGRMDGWKIHGRDDRGRPICFARTRPSAKHPRCHRTPEDWNGRCRFHGGLSNGSGRLKHGRYSKVLARKMAMLAGWFRPDLMEKDK